MKMNQSDPFSLGSTNLPAYLKAERMNMTIAFIHTKQVKKK